MKRRNADCGKMIRRPIKRNRTESMHRYGAVAKKSAKILVLVCVCMCACIAIEYYLAAELRPNRVSCAPHSRPMCTVPTARDLPWPSDGIPVRKGPPRANPFIVIVRFAKVLLILSWLSRNSACLLFSTRPTCTATRRDELLAADDALQWWSCVGRELSAVQQLEERKNIGKILIIVGPSRVLNSCFFLHPRSVAVVVAAAALYVWGTHSLSSICPGGAWCTTASFLVEMENP